jgi:pyrroline-5-carboxylate reductase
MSETLTSEAGDSPLSSTRLSFIGCGAMSEAMIAGLLRQKLVTPEQIIGSHPRAARREALTEKYGIRLLESNVAAVKAAESEAHSEAIVVLAVKPQRLNGLLHELQGALWLGPLLVSIIAGAQIETLAGQLAHPAVVRAMPNTPAQIGQGMTVWTATPEVTPAQEAAARALFGALGKEIKVETENMVDMATALSATGPTYAFLMMEALVDAGVHMGFSRRVAQDLVYQTLLGSVMFAMESHKHPAELRNMVTSPGGTSAEAIYQMEKGGLRTVFSKAVYAAYQRAVALGEKK